MELKGHFISTYDFLYSTAPQVHKDPALEKAARLSDSAANARQYRSQLRCLS